MIELNGEKWYTPSEVAKLKLVITTRGTATKEYVSQLLKTGKLKGKRYAGSEARPYRMVSESEIKRYNEAWFDRG